jgi:hypothetical protein
MGNHMTRRAWVAIVAAMAVVMASAMAGTAAEGKVPRPDGKLVFERPDPAVDDFDIMTANPDGSDLQEVLPGPAECPHWSPDGRQILVCVVSPAGLIRPAIMNANGAHVATLDVPDPTLNLGCMAWSGQGTLACEVGTTPTPAGFPGSSPCGLPTAAA